MTLSCHQETINSTVYQDARRASVELREKLTMLPLAGEWFHAQAVSAVKHRMASKFAVDATAALHFRALKVRPLAVRVGRSAAGMIAAHESLALVS